MKAFLSADDIYTILVPDSLALGYICMWLRYLEDTFSCSFHVFCAMYIPV